MSKFGATSKARLETCHPDLQLIFNTVIKFFDHSIVCGERTKEDQDEAVRNGFSKAPYPSSKHNSSPSMAVDAMPYFKDKPHLRWEELKHCIFLAGLVTATAEMLFAEGKITHKIRWGGDWDRDGDQDDQKFIDRPHYELIKV